MKLKNGNILKQFDIARNANASLIAIQTTDAAATIKSLTTVYADKPIAQWDIINGAVSLTKSANEAVKSMNTLPDGQINPSVATGNPVEMLMKIKALPGESIMCMHNAHMFIDKQQPGGLAAPTIQAVWNVRDLFRKLRSTLVMLCPNFTIPIEMQHDVLVLDEPLPYGEELQNIISRSFRSVQVPSPGKILMPKIMDATSGLAPFAIEQIISMSVTKVRNSGKSKVDVEQLWKRKIEKIEGTDGLSIHRSGPRFDDIGGNENIKNYLRRIAASEKCPMLVVFLDEIEKSMMAAGTDTSGVTSDQQKVMLTNMQDNEWDGILFYGFPGTGKSLLAKAFGHECDAITVEADLGAMKNIWVGSSEARMRSFMKIIKAMGGKKVFFVATCNHVEILRPELKRRFKHGIWFSDLPTKEEKDKIWPIHLKRFKVPSQARPDDNGWTGAEIENCCEKAAALNISLAESCRYMTIVSHAMGEEVEKMRQAAANKYVSTHSQGVYTYKKGMFDSLMGKGGN